MFKVKTAFNCAATGHGRVSLFALLLMVLAIDDDRQRREEERRKKREREAKGQRKPPAGPRPS